MDWTMGTCSGVQVSYDKYARLGRELRILGFKPRVTDDGDGTGEKPAQRGGQRSSGGRHWVDLLFSSGVGV